ncbi:MAG: NifB/NifX family molybdenum-iron cluster-binding protein [Clostridiales bacterium]|nr:NifB/NifX family molybdenum-iron cluster-binding protein [Candidatus Cacconaster stercorequi]
MIIAVSYENGEVFQHFGHSEQFKLYEVTDGKIVSSTVMDTNGSGHEALAGWLNWQKADILICGGIGDGAKQALAQAGIRVFGGVAGGADESVQALLDGTLEYDPNVCCTHHGEGHACGGCHGGCGGCH